MWTADLPKKDWMEKKTVDGNRLFDRPRRWIEKIKKYIEINERRDRTEYFG